MGDGDEKRVDGMALFMSLGVPSSGEEGRGIEAARGDGMRPTIEVARTMAAARPSRAGRRGEPLLPTTHEATDVAPLEPRDPEGFAGVLARADRLLGRTYLEGLFARWPVLREGQGSWEDFFTEGRRQVALGRMRSAEGFGLWECAAYFVADNATNALLAANAYKALVCGDESDGERAYLSLWDGASGARAYDGSKTPRQAALLASILNGEHPTLRGGREGSPYWEMTPGSLVSGKDLPWFLPLPLQSVPGLVVDEMAAFERSVLTVETTQRGTRRTLRLGEVYHLGRRDGAREGTGQGGGRAVELDLDAFTGHCLVTGATGSGKSNTVGVLLDGFVRAGVPFLAIEPAKGEYRNDFRWVRNADGSPIAVFSTHPCVGRLLRINPFRFPASVHVLEHIDRLLSVFASCWEMTEAQPMFLKKAVERAYADCGWNLFHSCFTRGGEPIFPTFAKLIGCLRAVISESDYDERAAQDLQAWVAGPARKEICERLAPGAWDAQQAAIATIEARLARAHEAELSGVTLFGTVAKEGAETIRDVPPVPLSEAAIREASARLAQFFGGLTERTRLARLGGPIVELLGLQTYWRELVAGAAQLRGNPRPTGSTLVVSGAC